MHYPLPGGDKCIYAFDSSTAHVHSRHASILRRKVNDNCISEEQVTSTASPFTGLPTQSATTVLPAPPGSKWTANVKNAKKCKGNGKAFEAVCEWKLCSECEEFWIRAKAEADKRFKL